MNRTVTFRTLLLANGLSILLLVAAMLATSTLAGPTWQAAPAGNTATTTTINYQGHLTNPGGTPVSATLPMTFNLYAAPTGGTAVWTEQRSGSNAVPVSNGLFNVALGSVTPIPVNLFGAPLWLGISVNGDAEMSPREQLASVPYAAVAGNVPQLLGEKRCDQNETGTPTTEVLPEGFHVVKCSNAQDAMSVTVATNGGPVVVHMTARYYMSPARQTYCSIAVFRNGTRVTGVNLGGNTLNNTGQGCSGSFVFTELPPGTYTFKSEAGFFGGAETTVNWKHGRQIAVFQF
ncbi:hypothetical protein [Candidatus Chloroploca asiatica]|uniref:Bacterial spore germination immunoglobulin-like domain-containing protein n=1 Tax=Candidatus Chloroploca asiatica TaxID=1506545 RepID=A0A2H3KJ49_9CHLR|nr:hypothetical protein [Candidatus Chloroploca asiatica]PDV97907.1 hypothetical protein A9Q02_16920 [Candidatus Chloroploca asiatica]